jgi:dienelactone hydrolase
MLSVVPVRALPAHAKAPVPSSAIVHENVARVRGGIRYDPTAPLNAVVTPRFDPSKPPTESLSYSVSYLGGGNERVPGVFVTPTNVKNAPCVLLLHGLGGSKEQMFLVSAFLAQKGYASFAIDAAGHGSRPKIDEKAVGTLGTAEMHTLAAQTIADLGRAVDFLATRPEVDTKRIGFLGISMGAILGGVFIGDDPRISTAVLWAGGADWGKLATTSAHPFAQTFRGGASKTAEQVEAIMEDVDPRDAIHNFAPHPILFINGDKDNIVPAACTDELYAAAGEPKTRVVLPGGHIPDAFGMLERSIAFFDAHLKP